jgi:hypothetical protein
MALNYNKFEFFDQELTYVSPAEIDPATEKKIRSRAQKIFSAAAHQKQLA